MSRYATATRTDGASWLSRQGRVLGVYTPGEYAELERIRQGRNTVVDPPTLYQARTTLSSTVQPLASTQLEQPEKADEERASSGSSKSASAQSAKPFKTPAEETVHQASVLSRGNRLGRPLSESLDGWSEAEKRGRGREALGALDKGTWLNVDFLQTCIASKSVRQVAGIGSWTPTFSQDDTDVFFGMPQPSMQHT
jgi:hypothetical protein